jgi:hypothetical protein
MPAPKTAIPAKRKGPAFKPPRPVNAPTQSAKSTTAASKRASGGVTKKPAASRPAFEAPTLISSSENEGEGEDEDVFSDIDIDIDEEVQEVIEREKQPAPQLPEEDIIPRNLLQRLLHEGFDDKDMGIQRGAMELTAKYMNTFVREAIARAQFERGDMAKTGDIMDGYLQVEDLERLTPQLVLDF